MSEHLTNNYRSRRIGNLNLITNDSGRWLLLTPQEFKQFKAGIITDIELKNKLYKNFFLIDQANVVSFIKAIEAKKSFLNQATSLHIIVPTLRCNYRCKYCHAASVPETDQGYDMDEETARKTVEFIMQSPSPKIIIEFQGGEPLLNFNIVKFIIEYIKQQYSQRSVEYRFVSNFSLMNEDIMNYLIDNKVGLCTSIDGPQALNDSYRLTTLPQGAYNYSASWLERINKEYEKRRINSQVSALVTVTRGSLSNYKGIIDTYVSLNLDIIHLRSINYLGNATSQWESLSYTAEEFVEFWKKSMDYILKLNLENKKIRERTALILLQKLFLKEDPNYLELRSPCGAIIGQLLYNYNGDIYTCDEGRMINSDMFMLGNVRQDKFKDVVSSSKSCAIIASSISNTYICEYCAYKPYCGLCPVCNYAEQGSIIPQVLLTSRCKITMAQLDYLIEKLSKDSPEKKVLISWLQDYS